jgi:hypothetical protein
MDNSHLTVIQDAESGMFHGALFQNHPTPSGLDRFLLAKSTTAGFGSERAAAVAINQAFPDLNPINVAELPNDDGILRLSESLPAGALVTHIIPSKRTGDDIETVEVFQSDSSSAPAISIEISPEQLRKMVSRKMLSFASSSGDDPNMHYLYNHYLAV